MWHFIYNVINGDSIIDILITNQGKLLKYED